MRRAMTLALLLLVASCAHSPPPTPLGAVPGRLSVVAETTSPYWKSLIYAYVPAGVNDYAYYQIVDESGQAPYRLVVRVVNTDSKVSADAANTRGIGVDYRTMVELEAKLLDQDNHPVWTWSGWADHKTHKLSMKAVAKRLGKAMSINGLLAPNYYTATAHAK